MEGRFAYGFGILFKEGGERIPTNRQASLLGKLEMNAAFVQPPMQGERIDPKGRHNLREGNEVRAFSTLVATGGGHGTTILSEDGFRCFDGDLARHFSPSLQNAPCAGHRV